VTQQEKQALWGELKNLGVKFDKHYRDYTTEDLRAALDKAQSIINRQKAEVEASITFPAPEFLPTPENSIPYAEPEPAAFPGVPAPQLALPPYQPPVREADEHAGVRQNQSELEALRTDPVTGFIWYQDEVRKPAYAKPRGRRKVTYQDPGVKEQTVTTGDGFTETFEMPGDEGYRQMEARITLPSYQVGIYRNPQFPFKIHVYDSKECFDYFEVIDFYGGNEALVPAGIKRVYVSSTLGFDIPSTIREIEAEYREKVLGKDRL